MKTGGVFMFKILFAGLLFLIFTQNIYAFTKVNVKYKEVSETAYEEGEQIFTKTGRKSMQKLIWEYMRIQLM